MSIEYTTLLKFIVNNDNMRRGLMSTAQIGEKVISRIRQDKYINIWTIEKICKAMNCKFDDIIKFK